MNDSADHELWRRADDLLDRALDLEPGERTAFVAAECAGEPGLQRLVERLLGHLEQTLTVADGSPRLATAGALEVAGDSGSASSRSALASGDRVGPYEILEELGRGGMSVVYLARRDTDAFDQRVAVKVIQGTTGSADAERRFLQERQILADADHPDIARLLDGGTTADGQHYLVMELIDGQPVDRYCAENRLTVAERVQLFLRVARAVASAHRMLIVHRDIKPSNVLVTPSGDVKLLDFGIAKLLEPGRPDAERTRTGAIPMTPAYASPEQVRGGTISTATDVYQLGALLYTLLTGRGPHGDHGSDVLAAAMAVVEEDPPRLWEAARDTTPAVEDLTGAYRTPAATLRRELSGDLEAVVMKALRKEPAARYGAVDGLADDLERAVEGRPVSARSLTSGYRLGLFVRRNRWLVAATVALGVLVAGWATTLAVQNRRISREAERANREARTAARVSEFLVDLFAEADPARTQGEELSVRTVLAEGRARIRDELADEPVVRARLLSAIAAVSTNLGLAAQAEELLAEALTLQRAELGPDHPQTVHTMLTLGSVHSSLGRHDEARVLLEDAVERARRVFGPDHRHTLGALNNLAVLEQRIGEHEAARTRLESVLEGRRRTLGPDHLETLSALANLGIAHMRTGDTGRGLVLVREARARGRESLGERHPWVLETAVNEALLLRNVGQVEAAGTLLAATVEPLRQVLGPHHPSTLAAVRGLAGVHLATGRADAAVRVLSAAAAALAETVGPDHPQALRCRRELADALQLGGDLEAARLLYREVDAAQRRALGPSAPDRQATLYNWACLEVRAGRVDDALEKLSAALAAGMVGSDLLDDPDLEPLHGHPEFEQLAAEMRRRLNHRSSSGGARPAPAGDEPGPPAGEPS